MGRYDAEEREAQSDGEDDDELNGNESEDDGGKFFAFYRTMLG